MGMAIDTVLCAAVNPGAGPTVATTAASGDPLQVRNANPQRKTILEGVIRMGTTAGLVQVTSPMLHDPVQGIRFTPGESPSVNAFPAEADQILRPSDTLTVSLGGGAAETDIALLQIYYEDLPGADARLHTWDELKGNVKNIKPLRVAVTSSATIGAWADFPFNTTETLLHADTDYAIVGYTSNSAFGAVTVRGSETANYRVGGPGSTSEFATSDYFALMSKRSGRPWVPVFNSANVGSVVASVCAATASVAGVVEFILAELASNITH